MQTCRTYYTLFRDKAYKAAHDQSLLHFYTAIEKGSKDGVRQFLLAGANASANPAAHPRCKSLRTPLTLAAVHGNFQVMQLLLENGAKINELDQKEDTALSCTVSHGDRHTAEYLINKGADPNLGEALVKAISRCEMDFVPMLLDAGACVQSFSVDGDVLELAVQVGSASSVRHILSALKRQDGLIRPQALRVASHVGKTEMVRILLDGGVDDKEGWALAAAIMAGHQDVSHVFLEGGDPAQRLLPALRAYDHHLTTQFDRNRPIFLSSSRRWVWGGSMRIVDSNTIGQKGGWDPVITTSEFSRSI